MKRKFTILGLLVIASLAVLFLRAQESSTKFGNLGDARSRLADAGLYCTPDKADGSIATGFLLSRAPTTWDTAGALCKVGNMGPEWEGRVWVTIRSPLSQLQTLPDNAGLRNWGNVFAFGDESLLRELDDLLP